MGTGAQRAPPRQQAARKLLETRGQAAAGPARGPERRKERVEARGGRIRAWDHGSRPPSHS